MKKKTAYFDKRVVVDPVSANLIDGYVLVSFWVFGGVMLYVVLS